jgi:hypothetical protein
MLPKIYFMIKDVFFSKESTWHRCLVAESGGSWSKIGF